MSLWRPFEVDVEVENESSNTEKPKESRMRIKVGEEETKIVMSAYLEQGDNGWKEVLARVKENVQRSQINTRIINYYLDGQDAISTRRLKRIVREEQKRQAELYRLALVKKSVNVTASHQTPAIKSNNNACPDACSEDDEPNKVTEASELDNDSDGVAGDIARVQMTYAKKQTPEKRKKDKFKHFYDSDLSSDEDKSKKTKKKKTNLREASYNAQTAHSTMCEQAQKTMGLMSNILMKLDKKLDDI